MLEYPQRPAGKIDLLKNMPAAENGSIPVPDRPGWGVEVDEDALAEFTPEG